MSQRAECEGDTWLGTDPCRRMAVRPTPPLDPTPELNAKTLEDIIRADSGGDASLQACVRGLCCCGAGELGALGGGLESTGDKYWSDVHDSAAEFAQTLANVGQIWSDFGQGWPRSARFAPIFADVFDDGHDQEIGAQTSPHVAQPCTDSNQF